MPDDLRDRLDAVIPGVHRRSLVMVAYDRHHAEMLASRVRRPGRAQPGTGSRNWTVRLHRDEHLELKALAGQLRWPVSALIRKLIELETAWEEDRSSSRAARRPEARSV
ncbi:MAG: hypothetical protein OXP08_08455 [bacterium]|nr:hypothetical protein [bacterium]